jgi:hypothetical protein
MTGGRGTKELLLEAYYDIKLRPGDTHRLKLGGLGSAGYAWEYAIEGKAGIVAVTVESIPSPCYPKPGGPPPDSYSIDQLLIITALTPGVAKVRVSLRRPWERDKPPLREICMDIVVSQKSERDQASGSKQVNKMPNNGIQPTSNHT